MTKEEQEQLITRAAISKQDHITQVTKMYDITSYVACCQYTNVSLSEWMGCGDDEFTKKYGMSDTVKAAIALEVNRITQEINKHREDQEQKLKFDQANLNNPNLSLGKPNTSFSRVYQ